VQIPAPPLSEVKMKRIIYILSFIFILLSVFVEVSITQKNEKDEFIEKIRIEIETIKSNINIKNPVNDYLKIAHLYIQIDELDNAIEYVNKAIHKDPKNPRAYYLLALIYEKKQDYVRAIDLWEKVLEYSSKKDMKEIAQKHIDYLTKIK